MAQDTILAPLPRRRQAQISRLLALTLVPLLLVLWTGPLPDRLPPPAPLVLPTAFVRRRIRLVARAHPRPHAAWVGRYVCRSGVPPSKDVS